MVGSREYCLEGKLKRAVTSRNVGERDPLRKLILKYKNESAVRGVREHGANATHKYSISISIYVPRADHGCRAWYIGSKLEKLARKVENSRGAPDSP